jgi:hypothetical protein
MTLDKKTLQSDVNLGGWLSQYHEKPHLRFALGRAKVRRTSASPDFCKSSSNPHMIMIILIPLSRPATFAGLRIGAATMSVCR